MLNPNESWEGAEVAGVANEKPEDDEPGKEGADGVENAPVVDGLVDEVDGVLNGSALLPREKGEAEEVEEDEEREEGKAGVEPPEDAVKEGNDGAADAEEAPEENVLNAGVLEDRAPAEDEEGVDVPNKEGKAPGDVTAAVAKILEVEEAPKPKGDGTEPAPKPGVTLVDATGPVDDEGPDENGIVAAAVAAEGKENDADPGPPEDERDDDGRAVFARLNPPAEAAAEGVAKEKPEADAAVDEVEAKELPNRNPEDKAGEEEEEENSEEEVPKENGDDDDCWAEEDEPEMREKDGDEEEEEENGDEDDEENGDEEDKENGDGDDEEAKVKAEEDAGREKEKPDGDEDDDEEAPDEDEAPDEEKLKKGDAMPPPISRPLAGRFRDSVAQRSARGGALEGKWRDGGE
ncbi:unnamed protein product [Spirodela intermedia]|uniref:Uncharacterized protein n=1 Tax=Spirodela intermedia TaxID=51605 RepID=A0A7I8K0G5_SPIIN|nr:unnamed protein product [Spirodela intermedia]